MRIFRLSGPVPFIFFTALALRYFSYVFFPNIYHADEIYQYAEQGHRLVFGYGIIPWEYRVGARSWLFPGLIAGALQASHQISDSSAFYQNIIAFSLSFVSASIVFPAYFWIKEDFGEHAATTTCVVMAVWFELVYFGSKTLSESIATTSLFWCAYFMLSKNENLRYRDLLGGALAGSTFAFRFHLSPALLLIGIISLTRRSATSNAIGLIAFLIVVAAYGFIDYFAWGGFLYSLFENIRINIYEDKASEFGVSAWFKYGVIFIDNWSSFVSIVALAALLNFRKSIIYIAISASIIASHTLIGHKEARFLLPAIPFLLVMTAVFTSRMALALAASLPGRRVSEIKFAHFSFWLLTSATLAMAAPYRDNFTRNSGAIEAFRFAGQQSDICGIGLSRVFWANTPGYYGLHKSVPIFPFVESDGHAGTELSYNYLISQGRDTSDSLYRQLRCFGNICVSRRDGSCSPTSLRDLNEFLENTGN